MTQRVGRQRAIMRYKEAEPDITTTGIGKNYKGYRMFHNLKNDLVGHIGNDGTIRPAKPQEIEQFRSDLASASRRNAEIGKYLSKSPGLAMREEIKNLKPEPEKPTGTEG